MPKDLDLHPYRECRRRICDGDVLLHRSGAWYAPFLRAAGRSEYSHASMAAWWHGRVHALQAVWLGDSKPLLSRLSREAPGTIDVYRSPGLSVCDQTILVCRMIEIVGGGYSWSDLSRAALSHIPFVRLIVPADYDDRAFRVSKAFCSEAIAFCYSRIGRDPVPNLSDRATEPGDLGRSTIFQYQFTIA